MLLVVVWHEIIKNETNFCLSIQKCHDFWEDFIFPCILNIFKKYIKILCINVVNRIFEFVFE